MRPDLGRRAVRRRRGYNGVQVLGRVGDVAGLGAEKGVDVEGLDHVAAAGRESASVLKCCHHLEITTNNSVMNYIY